MKYKVSVIIPVYNVIKYLHRCVESVINQTYDHIEIILVDDGSSDGSERVCDEYSKKFNNIICVHKKNAGLGEARNTGLLYATGEYVAFVDSDDYIERNMIEDMMTLIEGEVADMITSLFIYNGVEEKSVIDEGVYSDAMIKEMILPRLLGPQDNKLRDQFNVSACTKIYSKMLIDNYNLKFPSERELIWEDMAFNYNYLLTCSRVVVKNSAYYHYCYNEGSLTHVYDKSRFDKIMKMYQYFDDVLRGSCNRFFEWNRLALNFYGNFIVCIKLDTLYSDKIGMTNTIRLFHRYCEDERLKALLHRVPINKLANKQKILYLMIKLKLCFFMYLLCYLQNKKKNGIVD